MSSYVLKYSTTATREVKYRYRQQVVTDEYIAMLIIIIKNAYKDTKLRYNKKQGNMSANTQ